VQRFGIGHIFQVFPTMQTQRLDWMIWFVPTQQPLPMAWFGRFMQRLHQGSESVTALLENNPFPERPPRYLRVDSYTYRFSTPEERARSGAW
jgi:hypothetical protein